MERQNENKTVSKVQIIVSVLAILLATVFAFCPIIRIPLQTDANITEQMMSLIEKNEKLEMIDQLGGTSIAHSGVSLVASIPDTVELVGAIVNSIKLDSLKREIAERNLSDPEYEKSNAAVQDILKKNDLEKKLAAVDPDAINETSIANVRLCLNGLLNLIGDTDLGGDGFGMQIFGVLFVTLVNVVILAIVLILFPIKMLLVVIKLLPALLSKRGDAYSRSMRECPIMLGWYGVMLATLAVWGGSFTAVGWLFTAVAVGVLAVNVMASRSKSYTAGEKQYLNWMQICAVISLFGAVLFAISMAKADLIGFYLSSEVSAQILLAADSETDAGSMSKFLVYLLALCTSVVLVFVFRGVMGLLSRAACMNDLEKGNARTHSFGAITFGAVFIVINAISMNVFKLSLPEGQKGAFTAACVGIFIALAGEILLLVLRNVKMSNVTADEIRAVMCGRSVQDVEQSDGDEEESSSENA